MYQDKAIIGADSLIVYGDDRKKTNLKNFSKIRSFRNFCVGFSGNCTIHSIIKEMSDDPNYIEQGYLAMRSYKDALKFAKDVEHKLEDLPTSAEDEEGKEEPFGELLILTKQSIFYIDSYFFVSEYDRYMCIGSGEAIATGAMEALYKRLNNKDDLKHIVHESLDITCMLSTNCGGPVEVIEL